MVTVDDVKVKLQVSQGVGGELMVTLQSSTPGIKCLDNQEASKWPLSFFFHASLFAKVLVGRKGTSLGKTMGVSAE